MGFVYLVFILISLLVLYVFTQTIRFHILFCLDGEVYMNILCLYPLIKICVQLEQEKLILVIYVFRIKVYKTLLKLKHGGNHHGFGLVRSLHPRNICISLYYGFQNPCTTGLICGAVSVAAAFSGQVRFQHSPDFMAVKDYVYLEAEADIHLGRSVMDYARKRANRS